MLLIAYVEDEPLGLDPARIEAITTPFGEMRLTELFFRRRRNAGGDPVIQTLLTIAGHDPSSGAGATADLAVFAAHGFFGTSALTALTVQSTLGVQSTHAAASSTLQAVLACLGDDLPPSGIKLGMLASAENVHAVIEFIRGLRRFGTAAPIVLDPVVQSTSGAELLSASGLALLKADLLPLVQWVTPNLTELALLAECPVQTPEQMEEASEFLLSKYPGLNLVATGGHLESAADLVALHDGRQEWLPGERIASLATHGTGCAFASALLCGLVQGLPPFEAAGRAKTFVAEAIRRAVPLGAGNGPMNLLWPLRSNG